MDLERNLGEQPLARLMAELGLKSHDLVAASDVQITHKMISRALKGRRLTANTAAKVRQALSAAAGREFELGELFDYDPEAR
jgi:hypothetical protein